MTVASPSSLSLVEARAKAMEITSMPLDHQPRGGWLCELLVNCVDRHGERITAAANALRARYPHITSWIACGEGNREWSPSDTIYCLANCLSLPRRRDQSDGVCYAEAYVASAELAVVLAAVGGAPILSCSPDFLFGRGVVKDSATVLPYA